VQKADYYRIENGKPVTKILVRRVSGLGPPSVARPVLEDTRLLVFALRSLLTGSICAGGRESTGRLGALQWSGISCDALARRDSGFVLTVGGALVGFVLGTVAETRAWLSGRSLPVHCSRPVPPSWLVALGARGRRSSLLTIDGSLLITYRKRRTGQVA
jgi:hypothetical protein